MNYTIVTKSKWGLCELHFDGFVAYFDDYRTACMMAEDLIMKHTLSITPQRVRVSGVPYMVDITAFGMRK